MEILHLGDVIGQWDTTCDVVGRTCSVLDTSWNHTRDTSTDWVPVLPAELFSSEEGGNLLQGAMAVLSTQVAIFDMPSVAM